MFDLKRLQEVWPTLRGREVLMTLLRSAHGSRRLKADCRVWVHHGHVFVASNDLTIAFDVLPHSTHLLNAASSLTAVRQSQGWLFLEDCSVPCVEIFSPKGDHRFAGLLFADGSLEFWRFERPAYLWTRTGRLQLSVFSAAGDKQRIFSAAWHEDQQTVICCHQAVQTEEEGLPCAWCISKWRLRSSSQGDCWEILESKTALLDCPAVNIFILNGAVCLMPRAPCPNGLLLFWDLETEQFQPFLYSESMFPEQSLLWDDLPLQFNRVVVQLAMHWTTVEDSPLLLAAAPCHWTGELVALSSDGCVRVLCYREGHVGSSLVCCLHDVELPAVRADTEENRVQLLCHRSCLLLLVPDEPLRAYSIQNGCLLWQTVDLQLTGTATAQFWQSPKSHLAGAWNDSGVWLLQGRPIQEQAQLCVSASSRSDGHPTTPSSVAMADVDRFTHASLFLRDWGQNAWSVKYALEAASKAAQVKGGNRDLPLELPQQIIEVLDGTSLQTPGLLLCALAKFPAHRKELIHQVKRFLCDYHDDNNIAARLLDSPLTEDIVPILQEYMSSVEQYEALLNSPVDVDVTSPSQPVADVHEQVRQLVNARATTSLTAEQCQAQLELLATWAPAATLAAVKGFLGVKDFNTAVENIEGDPLISSVDWESVLNRESLAGFSSYHTVARFQLFELLCRLLYSQCPEQLVGFVQFAELVLDYDEVAEGAYTHYKLEHHFQRRALKTLPTPHLISSSTPSPLACRAYAQLTLNSGWDHSIITAIRFLLSVRMWSDALDLTKENITPGQAGHCEAFHVILVALIEANELQTHWKVLWALRPQGFQPLTLLRLLKQHLPKPQSAALDKAGLAVTDKSKVLSVETLREILSSMDEQF